MYFPVAGVEISPLALMLIGFMVGISGSFLGVGGGFIATPALNILGFPMSHAVGTDLAHMMGKSIVATLRHRLLGNVDFKLGGIMVLGSIPGVELAKTLVLHLDGRGQAEPVIRYVYIALLLVVSVVFFRDYLSSSRSKATVPQAGGRAAWRRSGWITRFRVPPLVTLPRSRIALISVWPIIGVGFVTGLAAGFLGVGGGFIRMPILLYLFGLPTLVAVGTDLFEIAISAAYGAFTYALVGRVDVLAALVMLSGAVVGAWVGTAATIYVRDTKIRLYLGLVVLAAALATALKQIGAHSGQPLLPAISNYLILGAAAAMGIVILASLLQGMRRERKKHLAAAALNPRPEAERRG